MKKQLPWTPLNLSVWLFVYVIGSFLFDPISSLYFAGVDPITLGLAGGTVALGGILNYINGQKNRQVQKQENEMNRQHDMDMLLAQYSAQQESIERANNYNSPVNQVIRYREAGLNPALLAANGQIGSGTSSVASPSAHSTPGIAPNYDELGSIGKDLMSFGSNLGLDSISPSSIQNRAKSVNDMNMDNIRTQIMQQEVASKVGLMAEEGKQIRENIRRSVEDQPVINARIRQETEKLKVDTDFQQMIMKYYPTVTEANLKVLQAQQAQLNAQAVELISRKNLNESQAREVLSREVLNKRTLNNMPELSKYQTDLIGESMVEQAIANVKNIGSQTDLNRAKESESKAQKVNLENPWTEHSISFGGAKFTKKRRAH